MKYPSTFRTVPRLTISLLALSATAAAAPFDGTTPLICDALQGHDCMPTQSICKRLEAPADEEQKIVFDVGKRSVSTPYRTDPLPIEHVTKGERALLLQGTTPEIVWNASVRHATGEFTITIADREGAYVVFGKCRAQPRRSGG